jgi:hypothetical protein
MSLLPPLELMSARCAMPMAATLTLLLATLTMTYDANNNLLTVTRS